MRRCGHADPTCSTTRSITRKFTGCRLIETLAEELALALIQEFDSPRVRVRVRKLHIPVDDFTTVPEIIVERVRS